METLLPQEEVIPDKLDDEGITPLSHPLRMEMREWWKYSSRKIRSDLTSEIGTARHRSFALLMQDIGE